MLTASRFHTLIAQIAINTPITDVVTEQFGGRAGLLLGAIACLVAAAFGAISMRRSPPANTPAVSVRPRL